MHEGLPMLPLPLFDAGYSYCFFQLFDVLSRVGNDFHQALVCRSKYEIVLFSIISTLSLIFGLYACVEIAETARWRQPVLAEEAVSQVYKVWEGECPLPRNPTQSEKLWIVNLINQGAEKSRFHPGQALLCWRAAETALRKLEAIESSLQEPVTLFFLFHLTVLSSYCL